LGQDWCRAIASGRVRYNRVRFDRVFGFRRLQTDAEAEHRNTGNMKPKPKPKDRKTEGSARFGSVIGSRLKYAQSEVKVVF